MFFLVHLYTKRGGGLSLKRRLITSLRNRDKNGVVDSEFIVILFYSTTKTPGVYPDNRIHLRVEVYISPEGVHSNGILLQIISASIDCLVHNKLQEIG